MSSICRNRSLSNVSFLLAIHLHLMEVNNILCAYTWFDAQEICQKHGHRMTLDPLTSDQFFWTGGYQRLSNWIKIIGCYNGSEVIRKSKLFFSMPSASAGLCQELCSSDNYSSFSVKSENCTCLDDDAISDYDQVSSKSCDYECNNTIEDKLSSACGGVLTYNVFSTETSLHLSPNQGNCVSLECSPGNPNFAVHNCDDTLNVICKSSVIQNKNRSWRNHLSTCAEDEVYPKGNFDVSNATASCTAIHLNHSDPKWVGIIREIFLTVEKEAYNHRNEPNKILKCQKCKAGSCLYTDCWAFLNNHIFCQNSFNVTIKPQSKSIGADEVSLGSIVALVIITLFIGAISCLILIIYKRRQRIRNKSPEDTKEDICLKGMDDTYSRVKKPKEHESNFKLENSNQNYDLATHKYTNAGSPYRFTEEGQYDHLRGKGHLEKETDDTYHHVSAVKIRNHSDYDVMGSVKDPEIENTYDKASPNGNSDNEYNELKLRKQDI